MARDRAIRSGRSGQGRQTGFQPDDELVGRHGPGHQITLDHVETLAFEQIEMFLCFDAFGDDGQVHRLADPDHGLAQDAADLVAGHGLDKTLVELDLVERQAIEVTQLE